MATSSFNAVAGSNSQAIAKRHIVTGSKTNQTRSVAYGSFYRSYSQDVDISSLGLTNIEYVNLQILDTTYDSFAILKGVSTSTISFIFVGNTSQASVSVDYYIEVVGS